MNDLRLLADGAANDPAAMLLRSARADKASQGSKDRLRAMLGIVDVANERNGASLPLPSLPSSARQERAKRSRMIARFIPFQNLISPPKPASNRKFSVVVVASVQVAAIFASLFARPLPQIEPVAETAAPRRDEPRVSIFVPKTTAGGSEKEQGRLSGSSPNVSSSRKDGFGAATLSRPAPPPESIPLPESIEGDEHVEALTQNDERPAMPMVPVVPESSGPSTALATTPMIYQAGMTQPVRIAGIDPSYPRSARLRGVQGTVIMRCVVTEKGLARNCITLNSPAYLDDAALSVTRTWRFTPVTWQGRPVSVKCVFKYHFKLG